MASSLSNVKKALFLTFLLSFVVLSGCFPSKDSGSDTDAIPKVVVTVSDDAPSGQAPSGDQVPVAPVVEPSVPAPVQVQAPSAPIPTPVLEPAQQADPEPELQPYQPVAAPSAQQADPRFQPITSSDPQSFLGISEIDVRRTSRDKGELKKMTLIVRNVGDYAFSPIVYMTFKHGVLGGRTEPTIIEQRFDLPKIEPGMKFVETYPVAISFHDIDDEKTISLRIQEKYVSPPYDFDKFTMTFVPRDEFKTQDISWT